MNINGHNLHVQARGPEGGPAVVLLHHGLGSTRAWRRQLSVLASAGYRAVAYDRWGYGHSEPRTSLGIPDFKDDQADLLMLLDELEVERVNLVGHSDGGTIALYAAAAHPERVQSLVVMAAHVYIEMKMLPGIDGIRQTFEQDLDFRAKFEKAHGPGWQRVFTNWYNGWLQEGNREWDMRPLLREIHCPCLVIQGLNDEHASPRHAMDIAGAIPGAELWLVPGAGHMLQREAPRELNRRLLDFLDQTRQDSVGLAVQESEHVQ